MDKIRCDWCLGQFPEYIKYHDHEWGVPVHNERKHFEFLMLEGAQAVQSPGLAHSDHLAVLTRLHLIDHRPASSAAF